MSVLSQRITYRFARPAVSGVIRVRTVVTTAVMAVLAAAAFCLALTFGDTVLSIGQVLDGLAGTTDDGDVLFLIYEMRLPRALVALLVGIAFAVSGAIFQAMTRNALASPDVIGIDAGAATAVVGGIVLGLTGVGSLALGLAGGLTTALLVWLLAWKHGTTGYRIVLVGIGVSWMCASITEYLLMKANIHEAQRAVGWMVGNLANRDWHHVYPLFWALGVGVPVVLLLSRWLRTLTLGDDVARGLGTPVQAARFGLLVAGVGLVTFATAAAGPIAFVALASPQIAQRLAGLAEPPLLASAATGAFVTLASDLVAQHIYPARELPVGVVTGALGAPLLLWLLIRARRATTGG